MVVVIIYRDVKSWVKSLTSKQLVLLATQNLGKSAVKSYIISGLYWAKFLYTQKYIRFFGLPTCKKTWVMSVNLKTSGQIHRTTVKLKKFSSIFPFVILWILYVKGLSFPCITTLYSVQLLVEIEEKRVYTPLFELQTHLCWRRYLYHTIIIFTLIKNIFVTFIKWWKNNFVFVFFQIHQYS